MRRARTRLAELLHHAAERIRPNPPGAATGTTEATAQYLQLLRSSRSPPFTLPDLPTHV